MNLSVEKTNIRFEVESFWGGREETHQQCLERLKQFLKRTSVWPDGVNRWYAKSSNLDGAHKSEEFLSINVRALEKNLKSISQKEHPEKDELGFSFSAWNCASGPTRSASLSIHSGSHCPQLGKYQNHLKIRLPQTFLPLQDPNVAELMVHDIAFEWDVDWLTIYQWPTRKKSMTRSREVYYLDYALYHNVRNCKILVKQLDKNITVVNFHNHGTLLLNTLTFNSATPKKIVFDIDSALVYL